MQNNRKTNVFFNKKIFFKKRSFPNSVPFCKACIIICGSGKIFVGFVFKLNFLTCKKHLDCSG